MSERLRETIGNERWLGGHESAIKALFPRTWTHMEKLNMLQIGFGLKVLGVEWHSYDELVRIMVFLEKAGLLIRQNGMEVRANPHSAFSRAASMTVA